MQFKERLRTVRTPGQSRGRGRSVLASVLCCLFGVALGVFAKWLDNLSLDSTVGWHRILESLDLRNVFSSFAVWLVLALAIAVYSRSPGKAAIRVFLFFAGMCASYHLYTVTFSGFHPTRYMMIWYALTAVSPLLAVVCWYAKGKRAVSIVLDGLILGVLAVFCFSVGWLYIGFNGILNALFFVAACAVLYSSPKQTVIAVLGGLALSVPFSLFLPH